MSKDNKIKKIECILAFGGSFSSGCELNNHNINEYFKNCNNIEPIDNITKEYSYPRKLSKLLNVPCYNYSMTAASNDRSMRLLPKAVTDHPNSLVLFEWGDTFRREFYQPGKNKHPFQDSDGFVQVGIHIYNLADQDFINKPYIEKIGQPYNNLEVNSFYVESVCQLYATKHYHLLFHHIDKLPNNLKNRFLFERYDNFFSWAESRKFEPTENAHYKEDAHAALANILYEDLKKN